MGSQPGGEDAQVDRQFPKSVTRVLRFMGEGVAGPGSPEEGALTLLFSGGDNT